MPQADDLRTSERWDINPLGFPVGILVHRSPFHVRLYLFSLNPRIPEVIIQKNTEPGRNNCGFSAGMDMVVFSDVTSSGGRIARYSCQGGSGWRVLSERILPSAFISKRFPLARNSYTSLRCPRALKFRHFSLIRYPEGQSGTEKVPDPGRGGRSLLFGSNMVDGDKNGTVIFFKYPD